MNKLYFSALWGSKDTKEFLASMVEVAKKHNGICYKCKQYDTQLHVSFVSIDNRRAFNKEVQKLRKDLNVPIDTCETKSVESYFGDDLEWEIIS